MPACKCRYCQTKIDTKDAYLVMNGKQKAYFCNEEHYHLLVSEKEEITQPSTTEEQTEEKDELVNPELGIEEGDVYTVQKGDTLASISKKIYGDTSYIDAICKMNGLEDGNLIYIGQKLLLP